MPDPTTESMRLDQIERARREKQRADKADYLREKLAERARAEDEAAERD